MNFLVAVQLKRDSVVECAAFVGLQSIVFCGKGGAVVHSLQLSHLTDVKICEDGGEEQLGVELHEKEAVTTVVCNDSISRREFVAALMLRWSTFVASQRSPTTLREGSSLGTCIVEQRVLRPTPSVIAELAFPTVASPIKLSDEKNNLHLNVRCLRCGASVGVTMRDVHSMNCR